MKNDELRKLKVSEDKGKITNAQRRAKILKIAHELNDAYAADSTKISKDKNNNGGQLFYLISHRTFKNNNLQISKK
jgi:hypothetical protein